MSEEPSPNLVELAAELTVAWLGNPNNRIAAADVPALIQAMYAGMSGLGSPAVSDEHRTAEDRQHQPAVTVRKSLASPDAIISMIDGKPYKMLTRHLFRHGLTPSEYRERYKLKADYPMVAANYSEHRRALAHKIGLGRKAKDVAAAVGEAASDLARAVTAAKPPRRPRKAAAADARKPRVRKTAEAEGSSPREDS